MTRVFTGTSDPRLRWKVTEGAKTVASGTRALDVGPDASEEVQLPAPPANPGGYELPHRPGGHRPRHTLHAVGDTPKPVRDQYRVKADRRYDYTLTLRPLTAD
ncbi:hypothetical protein [Streptomyces sp. NBRC 110028]|uniref:hypothetical protein n=1 Tax=Streptomyces sp. NBRC 110028 TaxID=1621260 RepID=UPI0006E27DCD|nr:hypothetical protein [Streptomyces sp. NBRC 110028]